MNAISGEASLVPNITIDVMYARYVSSLFNNGDCDNSEPGVEAAGREVVSVINVYSNHFGRNRFNK